mmetsp:Transcript_11637/g.31382  ORF Transcript_11637/g.31382 Transcript_11637/m.31382 type:complete len:225 (+) Transcript_11637:957-1631(+)
MRPLCTPSTRMRPAVGSGSSGTMNAVPTTKARASEAPVRSVHASTESAVSVALSVYVSVSSKVVSSRRRMWLTSVPSSTAWEGLPPAAPGPLWTCCMVHTANVRLTSSWAMRRGCSWSSTVFTCSFWMLSMLPIDSASSPARARLSGKAAASKGLMHVVSRRLTLAMRSLYVDEETTLGRSEAQKTWRAPLQMNGVSCTGCVPRGTCLRSLSAGARPGALLWKQ